MTRALLLSLALLPSSLGAEEWLPRLPDGPADLERIPDSWDRVPDAPAPIMEGPSEPRQAKYNWKRTLLVQSLAAGADLASTEYALDRGHVESAPMMGWGTWQRAGMKVAQVAVATWFAAELRKRGHQGWARAVEVGVPALNLGAAVHNFARAGAR